MKLLAMLLLTAFLASQTTVIQVGGVEFIDNDQSVNSDNTIKVITPELNNGTTLIDNPSNVDLGNPINVILVGENGHFVSIQEALKSEYVNDGDMIVIKSPQHLEKPLKIHKNLIIKSVTPGETQKIYGTVIIEGNATVKIVDLHIISEKDALIVDEATLQIGGNLKVKGNLINLRGVVSNTGEISVAK